MANVTYSDDVDVSALQDQITSAEHVAKANETKTFLAGVYTLFPLAVDVKKTGELDFVPGRLDVSVRYEVRDPKSQEKVGTIFAHFSPELHYRETRDGDLGIDKPAKLWGQAIKAFGLQKVPTAGVVTTLANYPLDGYISRYLQMPDGSFPSYKTEEEAAELTARGGVYKNSIANVYRNK